MTGDLEKGWWKGRIGHEVGVFPSNYVEIIPKEDWTHFSQSCVPKEDNNEYPNKFTSYSQSHPPKEGIYTRLALCSQSPPPEEDNYVDSNRLVPYSQSPPPEEDIYADPKRLVQSPPPEEEIYADPKRLAQSPPPEEDVDSNRLVPYSQSPPPEEDVDSNRLVPYSQSPPPEEDVDSNRLVPYSQSPPPEGDIYDLPSSLQNHPPNPFFLLSSFTTQTPQKPPAHKPFEKIAFRVIGSRTNYFTKGIIKIMAKELIYTDNEQQGDWVWPLLQIKGCKSNGTRFLIETGRLCPGGEKTYIFDMEEAAQLCDMVQRNIGILIGKKA